jgi:hypothetical protein
MAADFTKMVPGFDFLQSLMKGAGSSLPSMSQWIAPTLDAEEVDKRIQELRTVQFWLEQNAKMLGATIQALEVQRMTLATLKTMNLPMDDLRESMKLDPPSAMPKAAEPGPEAAPRRARPKAAPRSRSRRSAAAAGRRRPDAMVGRADAAVHRTGRQRDQGHAATRPPPTWPARLQAGVQPMADVAKA